jgi:hypothetical protein
MFFKRCIVLSPALYVMYPRKVQAHPRHPSSAIPAIRAQASYREKFEQLDKDDSILVTDKRRKLVSEKFGYAHLVADLERRDVDQLYYMIRLFDKPLTPERRIDLRTLLLPYLEKSKGEMLEFFEHILKYYEVV